MTPQDIEQIKQIIRDELSTFIVSDRYVFQKHLQLFDGRNIQTGKGTGTIIGTETSQKIGFWAKTPVDQPATVGDATAAGAEYSQSVANSAVTAINAIIDRLQEIGLIA